MNMLFVPAFDSNHLSSAIVPALDVDIKGSPALLPYGRRCGIRFEADFTVTLILGMRDPRWADASSYLSELVIARLGIPLTKLRIFYTGMQPAVRRAPVQSPRPLSRQGVGYTIAAVGDLVEEACELVVERARRAYAHDLGASFRDAHFDRSTASVLCEGETPVTLIDLAKRLRRAPR